MEYKGKIEKEKHTYSDKACKKKKKKTQKMKKWHLR